jgi:hypothetical protein
MTILEGVILCILGTTLTIIGFAIAYRIGSNRKKEDEETKERKRWRKIFPGWD